MNTELFIQKAQTYILKFRLRPSSRFRIIKWLYWHRLNKYRETGKIIAHFLHQRKTGGTAVKHVFKNQKITDKYVIESHGHEVQFNMIPPGDKVFFFIRNPITRYVSGFNSRKRYKPANRVEKSIFNMYSNPNELAIDLSSDDPNRKRMAEKSMAGIKHLAYSYWDCFQDKNYLMSRLEDVLFIGFQESLGDDFQKLKRVLHLNDDLQLPENLRPANRAPGFQDTSLDNRAIRNLEKWYENDTYFYNFCKELSGQINGKPIS